jgi:GT2 family glycosyltransferase
LHLWIVNIQLSIIIVNYRSWNCLALCLNSLAVLPADYEIVVIDNHSADGQLASFVAKYPHVNFIESEYNLGFGAGCHLGAKHSLGQYFLFLNPDTQASAVALAQMMAFLENFAQFGIVSCQQQQKLAKHFLLFPNFWRLFGLLRGIEVGVSKRKFAIKNLQHYTYIQPDWVSASVLMISRKNYENIDGFSKKIWMYYEDPDLCKRLSNSGLKVALLTSCSIYHQHGGATRSNPNTAALTKAEVTISRHVYIQEHFGFWQRTIAHICLIGSFLTFGTLLFLLSKFLFFVPKMRIQSLIYQKRIAYYAKVLKTGSWLSPNLINT